jgi:hypothetical protein
MFDPCLYPIRLHIACHDNPFCHPGDLIRGTHLANPAATKDAEDLVPIVGMVTSDSTRFHANDMKPFHKEAWKIPDFPPFIVVDRGYHLIQFFKHARRPKSEVQSPMSGDKVRGLRVKSGGGDCLASSE